MPRDYYEVLGVDKSVDNSALKKAYRKLAMKFHPDKNPGDQEAEDKFKEAAEAYEVLSNSEKRVKYDRFGHSAPGGFGGGQGFHDVGDIFSAFGDIFGDFFGGTAGGGRGRRNGPRRGADLRYYLDIDLTDVLSGIKKQIEFDAESSCNKCSGSGAKPGTSPTTCNTCGGAGQVIRQQGFFQMASTCHSCKGQGQVITDPCVSCHGSGREKIHKKLMVNVPAGVDTGTQLRLTDEGEGGFKGGPAGDLYVEVRVKKHKVFERQAQTLFAKLEVTYIQALLGAEISVDTLEGTEKLKVPKGTNSGVLLKLETEGLPSIRSSRRGDIVYEVDVKIPKKLAKKEEELLREIASLKNEEVAENTKGIFGF